MLIIIVRNPAGAKVVEMFNCIVFYECIMNTIGR